MENLLNIEKFSAFFIHYERCLWYFYPFNVQEITVNMEYFIVDYTN